MKKFTVDIDDTIKVAIEKILINGHRTVIVLRKQKVCGTISEGDILKTIIYKKKFNSNLSSVMNKNFKYLEYNNLNEKKISQTFLDYLCQVIPIVDKNLKLKKIITLEEFLKKKLK